MRPPNCSGRTAGVPPAFRALASRELRGWRSRGYLTHLDTPNLVQHIVFRLADSLPAAIREELTNTQPDDRVLAIDAALDRGHGRRDLANPAVGALVQGALLAFDGERYAMNAWCIMPNHVHALVEIRSEYRLDQIVHSWKSYTSKRANRLLGRIGSFWSPEYFDRYMRDDEHFAATIAYIEGNPVKAGLCEEIADWRLSSAWSGWGGRDARGPELGPRSVGD
jgi:REP element-mobilizing transposase RayT